MNSNLPPAIRGGRSPKQCPEVWRIWKTTSAYRSGKACATGRLDNHQFTDNIYPSTSRTSDRFADAKSGRLVFVIPSERPKAYRHSGRRHSVSACLDVGLDGPRCYRGVYQGKCHERVSTGAHLRVPGQTFHSLSRSNEDWNISVTQNLSMGAPKGFVLYHYPTCLPSSTSPTAPSLKCGKNCTGLGYLP